MPLMFPSQRSEPEGAEEKGDTTTDSKDKTEEEDLAKLWFACLMYHNQDTC